MGRRLLALLLVALAVPAFAAAAAADKEKVHVTAEGQAAARAALPRPADFGTGWTSKTYKPSLDGGFSCGSFDPKQSDLVRNGAAGVRFTHPGLEVDTETQVLQTPHMVTLDWQRTVLPPQVLPCMRSSVAKSLPAGATIVSVKRTGFPHVATYSNAFRILLDLTSSGQTVHMFVDIAVFGRGRTEITMTTTAPLAAAAVVRASEVRLARLLTARVTA